MQSLCPVPTHTLVFSLVPRYRADCLSKRPKEDSLGQPWDGPSPPASAGAGGGGSGDWLLWAQAARPLGAPEASSLSRT